LDLMGSMRRAVLLVSMGFMVLAGCGGSNESGVSDGSAEDSSITDAASVSDSSGDSQAPGDASGVEAGNGSDGGDAGPAKWDISSWDNAMWN
jgi:hypothetical protein